MQTHPINSRASLLFHLYSTTGVRNALQTIRGYKSLEKRWSRMQGAGNQLEYEPWL